MAEDKKKDNETKKKDLGQKDQRQKIRDTKNFLLPMSKIFIYRNL